MSLAAAWDDWSWQNRGECKKPAAQGADFFPKDRRSREARAAKRICEACPVKSQCLRAAMDVPDTAGIWGGTDDFQRAAMGAARNHDDDWITT